MPNKKHISVVILLTLVLSACTFDSSPKNDNNVDISDSEISTEDSNLEESITQKVEEKTEDDKPNIIIPDIDYSSLPTLEIEFDSIKLFKEPIKFESNDIFIHNEIGIITDGKYKNYIFGTARFGGQFGDHKTDFHLREPGKSNLLYLAESTKYIEEERNRQTISDFEIPSLEFEEESITVMGNQITSYGELYYDLYFLDKIKSFEKVTSDEIGETLYQDGWAFYRIIKDNFYLLYQYSPEEHQIIFNILDDLRPKTEGFIRYVALDRDDDGRLYSITGGYTGLFDDNGFIQGETEGLDFNNLEHIYDGNELNLYLVKEFTGNNSYESKLINELWEESSKVMTKEEFIDMKPIAIMTNNFGTFSVKVRSDVLEPFEA